MKLNSTSAYKLETKKIFKPKMLHLSDPRSFIKTKTKHRDLHFKCNKIGVHSSITWIWISKVCLVDPTWKTKYIFFSNPRDFCHFTVCSWEFSVTTTWRTQLFQCSAKEGKKVENVESIVSLMDSLVNRCWLHIELSMDTINPLFKRSTCLGVELY